MREFTSVAPQAAAVRPDLPGGRAQRTQFLDHLVCGLIRASTEQDIVDLVVDLGVRDTAARSSWLMLIDTATGELTTAGERSMSAVAPDLDPRFASWVASSGTALRFDAVAGSEEKDARFGVTAEVTSLLCLPLVGADGVIGVWSLGSPSEGAFSEHDQRSFTRGAGQVAAALDRARRSGGARNLSEAELERQVAEYRKRLVQADKMASLGGLLAGIVHELNNPLTTILGFAQLMARTGSENRSLDTIISESERCGRIVQSVLRFARTGVAQKEVVVLNDAVRETLALASYQLRLHRVTLDLHLARENPSVWVDPNEFTQVLLNLVNNAVQAVSSVREEGGSVAVRTETIDGRVSIRVEDNGPGMDQDCVDAVFDPFFTTKECGTGLGLSLSRTMVEANDGTIVVRSVLGEGTTFIVEFPAQESSESKGAARKRVLVVDDEQHILELVREVLSDQFVVECVSSGEAGVERIKAVDYDLVISDLRMPGMGGVELVEWVRAQQRDPRILLLTGDIVSRDVVALLAASGVSCLSKPFKIEELAEAVGDMLCGDNAKDTVELGLR